MPELALAVSRFSLPFLFACGIGSPLAERSGPSHFRPTASRHWDVPAGRAPRTTCGICVASNVQRGIIRHWTDRCLYSMRRGYRMLSRADTERLLLKYRTIPEGQIETSVVLANARWT